MKKYLVMIGATLFSTSLLAGNGMKKIDTDFDSLDNNQDGYVSQEGADDNNVWDYFSKIDSNQDKRLSKAEFQAYTRSNPNAVEVGEEIPESK